MKDPGLCKGTQRRGVRTRTTASRRKRVVGTIAVVISALLVLAGCGSSKSTTAASGSSGAAGSACNGAPLKVMTIFSQSGELGVFGNDVPNAALAAEHAINAQCSLGRPLQVTVCDDQSTPNGSLECGDKAKTDGYLAIVGMTAGPGGSDEGAQAADLPALFTSAVNAWDDTSIHSYPDTPSIPTIAGQVKLAKAIGATSYMLAAVDIPPAHQEATIIGSVAKQISLPFKQTYFPLDTTDYSGVGAQITTAKPGALDFLLPEPEQFLTALAGAGANFQETKLIAEQGILTPTQQVSLSKIVQGSYQVGSLIPPSASSNPAIVQMKKEYREAGVKFSPLLSTWSVQEWSAVHALADALQPLGKKTISSLTTASLLKAVVGHGVYNVTGVVPFDYGQPAFPKSSVLSQGGRVFSKYVEVFQVEHGVSVPIGGPQNVDNPLSVKP